ncbi:MULTISPECIES: DUF2790 domain-containing protein [Pseudomonas]|nr:MULTISPECIES: DUF2790 domain-containing protein [Pseudomonas]HCF2575674.1 DUF2790 domain-containing protein [Pseudomonas aeruginosa]ELS0927916.1 DUF2790 domain-containing protein [Pseudomonas putida]KYC17393.1 hypothetical protein WM94_21900 [Pseudomonas sp. ABFPK]MBA1320006.1 DUF2790 domain-containing protein [Pseudomonas monteilii]MDH0025504.1 DUF2790 domain-containing protein [Pseudomonas monteilii]
MNVIKAFAVFSVLSAISSLAVAEGGGDRVYGRMIQENQRAMEQYAVRNGKAAPEVVHYKYGMDLDIKKIVSVTQANKNCSVAPSRMTYEDSSGKLNTVEYRVMGSDCPHGG